MRIFLSRDLEKNQKNYLFCIKRQSEADNIGAEPKTRFESIPAWDKHIEKEKKYVGKI